MSTEPTQLVAHDHNDEPVACQNHSEKPSSSRNSSGDKNSNPLSSDAIIASHIQSLRKQILHRRLELELKYLKQANADEDVVNNVVHAPLPRHIYLQERDYTASPVIHDPRFTPSYEMGRSSNSTVGIENYHPVLGYQYAGREAFCHDNDHLGRYQHLNGPSRFHLVPPAAGYHPVTDKYGNKFTRMSNQFDSHSGHELGYSHFHAYSSNYYGRCRNINSNSSCDGYNYNTLQNRGAGNYLYGADRIGRSTNNATPIPGIHIEQGGETASTVSITFDDRNVNYDDSTSSNEIEVDLSAIMVMVRDLVNMAKKLVVDARIISGTTSTRNFDGTTGTTSSLNVPTASVTSVPVEIPAPDPPAAAAAAAAVVAATTGSSSPARTSATAVTTKRSRCVETADTASTSSSGSSSKRANTRKHPGVDEP
mmetsp:Transcript_10461/g.17562  ORF Transcript_10461/g.17562 Transcript_10461/m.17562 type:complete len:423 (-) Transcript_10461:1800-3068(-)